MVALTCSLTACTAVGLLAAMVSAVSRAKAEPYLGQRVLVSVRNSTLPIAGTVLDVTNDGVLLEDNGREVGVSYRRISAIEVDRSSGGLVRASPLQG